MPKMQDKSSKKKEKTNQNPSSWWHRKNLFLEKDVDLHVLTWKETCAVILDFSSFFPWGGFSGKQIDLNRQLCILSTFFFARHWLSEKLICDKTLWFSRHYLNQFAAKCGFSDITLLPAKSHQGLVENYAQVMEYLLMGFAGSEPDVWLALSIMEWQQWSMDCYLLTSCTAEKWKAGIPVSQSLGTRRSIKKQMRQNRKKSAWLRSQEMPSLHSFP